ncbi:MAG: cation:proton antiporter [Kofleriaceae bacterium]|nr:cation:proton antiporter [Kofleriaceae bacterium]
MVFLLLLLALIVAPLVAAWAHLPPIFGLVCAGMVMGPHGLDVLVGRHVVLDTAGNIGLLYAMFVAGLELELAQFTRYRRTALLFALASFAIPFVLGVTSARLLGYAGAAAVLLGASWGSHTLVTYPRLRELGLAHHRAVTTVVGATPATSILVVCVLAHISVDARRGTGLLAEGIEIVLGLGLLALWSGVGLPRLARRFFAFARTDSARFVFALAAMCVAAIVAEAAGMPGIVGAFFAGLGLGRVLPAQSELRARIEFVGSALFVPIFLLWVGMRVDPRVFLAMRSVAFVLVFTAIAVGGKALAAVLVGRHAAFDRAEIGVMSGLASSQVAITLAAAVAGAHLGVFDAFTVHVVLAVILATVVVTPLIVEAFGRRLAAKASLHG